MENQRKVLEKLYREMAFREARTRRDRLAANCVRLGKVVTTRISANNIGDVWEEGYALKDLQKRSGDILQRKVALENRKKELSVLKRKAKKEIANATANSVTTANVGSSSNNNNSNNNDSINADGMVVLGYNNGHSVLTYEMDIMTEEAAIRMHQESLKKEELSLAEEKRYVVCYNSLFCFCFFNFD
jgi:hypothetical protein